MKITQEPSTATVAASLHGASKAYKHFRLADICLDFEQGTVCGLIGPNGAGKSTVMRILMGLVRPDSGDVTILGQPVSSRQAAARQDVGYFSDDMRLYKTESLGWHMQFVRSLYPRWDDSYAKSLLERFGLLEEQTIKGLSQGQRVKALLLLVLARRPRLLILDEPTNGLDPVARHEVLNELMRVVAEEDRTILYSSHNTRDIEQICDSLTFIDRGRVIASSGRDDFLERWRRIRILVPAVWNSPEIRGLFFETAQGNLRIGTTNEYRDEIVGQLQNSGATIEAVEPMTLEEIFINSVMRGREKNQT
jgi:ABC-2 type transport system ATP-binding protein